MSRDTINRFVTFDFFENVEFLVNWENITRFDYNIMQSTFAIRDFSFSVSPTDEGIFSCHIRRNKENSLHVLKLFRLLLQRDAVIRNCVARSQN